jgi:hypothetical protein
MGPDEHTTDVLPSVGRVSDGPRRKADGRHEQLFLPNGAPAAGRARASLSQKRPDHSRATDFESDRETLLGYVEKLCSCDEDFKFSPHGKFGPMSRKEWGILAAKHIDHHLKQFGV